MCVCLFIESTLHNRFLRFWRLLHFCRTVLDGRSEWLTQQRRGPGARTHSTALSEPGPGRGELIFTASNYWLRAWGWGCFSVLSDPVDDLPLHRTRPNQSASVDPTISLVKRPRRGTKGLTGIFPAATHPRLRQSALVAGPVHCEK